VPDPSLRSLQRRRDQVANFDRYPYSIPAIGTLGELQFHPRVMRFAGGGNGSGTSTVVEAVAVAAGFNAEGGSRNKRSPILLG
jgi:predicted ATPase